jgi:FAD/FMN-containing dehydrogenase
MTPNQIRLLELLRPTLPYRAIITDPETIAPWETDWRARWSGRAPIMFEPSTVEEVQKIIVAANREVVPIVPQGGNTSMVGGATPPSDGIAVILSLRRLNRVRSLDSETALAIVEAGVILSDFHTAAVAIGRRFPLTLGARGSATIGGLVSTNAGGTQVLRWGTMRGLVAGVEAVLPNGSLYEGLSALKKDNRGYDLNQLLIGAEGTLGIVTAATLRLAPAIAARAVAWIGLDTPEAALRLLRKFDTVGNLVESFELLPADSLSAVLAYIPNTRAPLAGVHRWHVLIEAVTNDQNGESPVVFLESVLAEALDDEIVDDAVIAASEAQADAFWRIRESISDAERATGPAAQHDISVPVEAMPRFLIEAAAACDQRFPGTHASGFGHLGDGNVHFHVRAPAGADRVRWLTEEAPGITRFVDDLVVAAGGSISAEHGIGQMKLKELERLSSPARMAALRAIKAAFDPSELFNPGKLVRLGQDSSTIVQR